ncbi:glycoside hydrolase family 16 protein [Aurantiacibacter sediminis]|uniref:Glycoside hydrolase family 16 protein n=1 Tax=Aurantiacibacter sediminis TaxID=2793064 RepID=A0ABS0N4G5_9SPHN|nr:glycoside hydrolase family 16 protein [Aurantiacibacter sediminis]MBH5321929.1 glycoside hydrolase family 16 protein [Aurantiacibacter sediminis]
MRTFTFPLAAPLAALALTACAADATAQDLETASQHPRADRELIFSDEFNSGTLDRTKWTPIGMDFWVNDEEQAYVDSPETIQFAVGVDGADGGVLVLRPIYQPGQDTNTDRNADFLSGRIESLEHFTFTYGRAEARIRMPDARGVWPAFWLLADAPWPSEGEIDIMEYVGESDWTGVAVHGPGYSGDMGIADRQYFTDGSDVTDWHVYAVEWKEDAIEFFVDDVLTFRIPRTNTEFFGEWVFDNPQGVILNFAAGGIYPRKINGIEEPYVGMPQETADRIAAGEIAMEVDWVRVYGAVDQ